MNIGIVGGNGMIGSNLAKQLATGNMVKNITRHNYERLDEHFDTLYVSAANPKKYLVNANPNDDVREIKSLVSNIAKLSFDRLILISTVDVYGQVKNRGDENTQLKLGAPSYGNNRLLLEYMLRETQQKGNFKAFRLQGIIADNLTKNALFDLKHKHQLSSLQRESIMQWYPIDFLTEHLNLCNDINSEVINLSCEPLQLSEIINEFTPDLLSSTSNAKSYIQYDVTSIYSKDLIGNKKYWVSKEDSLIAIQRYLAS